MWGPCPQVFGPARIVHLEASAQVCVQWTGVVLFGLDAVVASSAHRIEQVFTVYMLSRSGRKGSPIPIGILRGTT